MNYLGFVTILPCLGYCNIKHEYLRKYQSFVGEFSRWVSHSSMWDFTALIPIMLNLEIFCAQNTPCIVFVALYWFQRCCEILSRIP